MHVPTTLVSTVALLLSHKIVQQEQQEVRVAEETSAYHSQGYLVKMACAGPFKSGLLVFISRCESHLRKLILLTSNYALQQQHTTTLGLMAFGEETHLRGLKWRAIQQQQPPPLAVSSPGQWSLRGSNTSKEDTTVQTSTQPSKRIRGSHAPCNGIHTSIVWLTMTNICALCDLQWEYIYICVLCNTQWQYMSFVQLTITIYYEYCATYNHNVCVLWSTPRLHVIIER